MATKDPKWSLREVEGFARIYPSDVARALELLRAASPELAEMAAAEEVAGEETEEE